MKSNIYFYQIIILVWFLILLLLTNKFYVIVVFSLIKYAEQLKKQLEDMKQDQFANWLKYYVSQFQLNI